MLHSKVDLNLFPVLTAIYQEGSITAAAKKLHLTQPAVSHALARLRDKFSDPLFVRHGRKMVPSTLCQQIMPDIMNAIGLLNSTITNPTPFDISQHKREMKLGLRDILETTFFPSMIKDLYENTPNISINSFQIKRTEFEQALEQQMVDIIIDVLTPTHQDINSQLICHEQFSLICRPEHPILKERTLEYYASATHALVSLKDSRVNAVDMALAKYQISRNVALQCEHYIAAVEVVANCDMIMTLPNSYARFIKDKFPIVVSPLPFDIPPLPIHMYWHKQAELDPVNNWLRQKISTIAATLFDE